MIAVYGEIPIETFQWQSAFLEHRNSLIHDWQQKVLKQVIHSKSKKWLRNQMKWNGVV